MLNRGTQVVIERLRISFADGIKYQIEDQYPAEQLGVAPEILANHFANAQIGLAMWWLENDKPYPPEYMAQASLWLSMAGNARGWGGEDFPIAPPPIPKFLKEAALADSLHS